MPKDTCAEDARSIFAIRQIWLKTLLVQWFEHIRIKQHSFLWLTYYVSRLLHKVGLHSVNTVTKVTPRIDTKLLGDTEVKAGRMKI